MAKRKKPADPESWKRIRSQPKWSAGYTEFRYGLVSISKGAKGKDRRSVDVRSRITLAGQKPQKPILNKDKRKHVIHTLFDAMQDWRFSPFQHEGTTRNHLRSVFCESGYDWNRSDAEASALVAETLKGYARPSWNEGQPSYTASIVICRGCGGPLDDYEITHGVRYCCEECKRMVLVRAHGLSQGAIDLPPTTCASPTCSTVFYPRNASQRYCCRACAVEGRKTELPPKDCLTCGNEFQPSQKSQLFCCRRCRELSDFAKSKERRHAALKEVTCPECLTRFFQKRVDSVYCSERCQKRAYRKRTAKEAT